MNQPDRLSFTDYESRKAKFKALSESDQLMVEIVALFHVDISSADLARILRHLFAKTSNNFTYDTAMVEKIYSALARREIVSCSHGRILCSESYREIACRNSVLKRRAAVIREAINQFLNNRTVNYSAQSVSNYYSPERAFRLDFFSGLLGYIPDEISGVGESDTAAALARMPFLAATLCPFEPEWFSCLPIAQQVSVFRLAHRFSILYFADISPITGYFLDPEWLKSETFLNSGAICMAEQLFFQGRYEEAELYLKHVHSAESAGVHSMMRLVRGDYAASVRIFQEGLKLFRKQMMSKILHFNSMADIFHVLALLGCTDRSCAEQAESFINECQKKHTWYPPLYRLSAELIKTRSLNSRGFAQISEMLRFSPAPLIKFLAFFVRVWNAGYEQSMVPMVNSVLDSVQKSGLKWFCAETLNVKSQLGCSLNADEKQLIAEVSNDAMVAFSEMLKPLARWEIVIEALRHAVNPAAALPTADRILVWEFRYFGSTSRIVQFELIPREKTRLKSGRWSSGKAIDPNRLANLDSEIPDFYTSQDIALLNHLKGIRFSQLYVNDPDTQKLLPLLIDHPLIFSPDGNQLKFVAGSPVLVLEESENGLDLSFQPSFVGSAVEMFLEMSETVRIYRFDELQVRAGQILLSENQFPEEARAHLIETVSALAGRMQVHSTVEGVELVTPVQTVEADARLYALLTPDGDGLRIKLGVKPLGSAGPLFAPGDGSRDVYGEVDDQKLHCRRNFKLETENVLDLEDKVPLLRGILSADFVDWFETADEALDLLLNLGKVPEIIIEWPAGHKIRKVTSVSSSQLRLQVNKAQDWFSVDGSLQVDEDLVIDFQQLLQKFETDGSRYIRLSEGQYLALTEEFYRRMNDWKSFADLEHGQPRFHSLMIPALNETFEDLAEVEFDKKWHAALNKFLQAEEMTFEVPADLKADLREYQREAFNWLCRINELGLGACLADDMGLGKTVEALALILHKAIDGPTLVVAPTSVCMNWLSEISRFAPALKPVIFSQCERQQVVESLGAYDLVICSYGIMHNEIERLAEVDWATVVLDEAQAIKNMATSRSQSAMKLNGRFKMIMTGTPIENHLGELWNLFRFINPGLLGSLDSFNRRFAAQIQDEDMKEAHERLRRLIRPFILRRTKNQVLQDLPPRTEITLSVDLSAEEAALYENTRRQAIDKISDSDAHGGQKHIMILAELMKLRRLCCNPALVAPELKVSSSKMALLETVVDELLENKHKALIFSQFVDHLTLVRQMLDKKNISFQYLDGSTPTKSRTKAINAFQAGEGDLFLISLKAGGLGLNLTAADYVIHLDPWWNPAVEDQASDRAHRIGQTRPVTIYRLITSRTIEEKIVELHHRKRDLATGLLEGTDITGRITSDELFALLKETSQVC